MTWEIRQGDCIELMAEIEEASVDAVVCDPPYGIGFMGHEWDQPGDFAAVSAAHGGARVSYGGGPHPAMEAGRYDLSLTANQRFQAWCEVWATECLRILKPGGHMLVSGGSRTHHRLASGIEDAGFEIRDRIETPDGRLVITPDGSLAWYFGSGFPKSLDVSKAIDKAAGAEREVVGKLGGRYSRTYTSQSSLRGHGGGEISAPATDDAAQWDGWGTALKPAHEPIVVARKPLIGTVAQNVLEHGTGAINIDACRIAGANPSIDRRNSARRSGNAPGRPGEYGDTLVNRISAERYTEDHQGEQLGRWPANVVLSHHEDCEPVGVKKVKGDQRETGNGTRPGGFADVGAETGDGEPNARVYGHETVTEWNCVPGCPVAELDAQSGNRPGMPRTTHRQGDSPKGYGMGIAPDPDSMGYGDAGGASRFFYCAKTSRAERNAGLEGFEERENPSSSYGTKATNLTRKDGGENQVLPTKNHHPTVKPIDLMRWLVRMVTPPGGLVLDCFAGSGSTGCAAVLEGFNFLGLEREAEYVEIAEARIAFWAQHEGREVDDVLGLYSASRRESEKHADIGQEAFDLEAAA